RVSNVYLTDVPHPDRNQTRSAHRISLMATLLTFRSHRTAAIDVIREEHAGALSQVLDITGFALATAAAAHVRIYLWQDPITLQTGVVYASGLSLSWRNGMLAQPLSMAAGMFLRVFAGDGMGAAYVLGAVSGGYLLAYPAAAA